MNLKINTSLLRLAAILGALSVILGAFAAHGLKDRLSQQALSIFEVGVRYQFYHVFALAIVAIVYNYGNPKRLKLAANLLVAGIVLFSGSLYALSMIYDSADASLLKIGIITPFGGLCFIAGWLLLAFSFSKQTS